MRNVNRGAGDDAATKTYEDILEYRWPRMRTNVEVKQTIILLMRLFEKNHSRVKELRRLTQLFILNNASSHD